MISIRSLKKFGLLGSLYVSQFMPFWFLYQALPLFMRQKGVSLETIGLLQLLALPISLNFLWSPLIDRYGFTRWGHYRFWIICFQLLIAAMTAICALLSVENNFTILLICITLISLFSASQDIATDALAIGLLKPNERGLGNAVQIVGNSLGSVVSGGGMLILFNYWGWAASLQTLALIMVLALVPIFLYRENVQKKQISINRQSDDLTDQSTVKLPVSYFQTFINFCRHPGMMNWLLILVLYSSSSHMAATMYRPLLVDIGLSLSDIGWLQGVVGTSAAAIGGIVGGLLISAWGRKRSLFLFSLLWATTMLTYLFPAFGFTSLPVIYLVAISPLFSIGIMSTATSTLMMDNSSLETPGTDYTLQSSVSIFASLGAGAISGVIAKAVAYRGIFSISLAIALISVLMIFQHFKGLPKNRSQGEHT
ncbi:MFS transporter [Plectonema radiosum NIES-515]|uniref:MFS transporter n=1 Tax=Plectonema radiosum NIES-515 TaxID=2986073 RepID=A0ABT3B5J7_9CYAN|nr:MFS transporter [Plectonema radiosum]MCV3216650.1 MFS transporter [Plectonema radiosum NIES-515]